MTVKELINNLQEYPDDANVILGITIEDEYGEEYENEYDILDTYPFRHDKYGDVKEVMLIELER